MKTVCSFFVLLLFREAISGIVRKPPAFSTPVYSDSYLPAAMQVIFHAVEQLKLQQLEESLESTTVPSMLTSQMTHVAQSQLTYMQETVSTVLDTTTKVFKGEEEVDEEMKGIEVPAYEKNSTKNETGAISIETIPHVEDSVSVETQGDSIYQELPEVNEEVPEMNYATPETNYEAPEDVTDVDVANQEVVEENYEVTLSPLDEENLSITTINTNAATELKNPSNLISNQTIKKEPTIESVVEGIYEIVKPTPSELLNENAEPSDESKSVSGVSVERLEIIEEEKDENRYTLLGEKVTQVPRPSLISYLKRAKVPPSVTLQQLASLYDSLSKDTRKQGFGKYTGYSDQVLHVLRTSAEGGIGSQLKKLLDKVMEQNELMREDAKTKTTQAIRDLDNPSSSLSKELRTLLPLRYSF